MFTRVVELTTKSGKSKELANTIDEKIVPILKRQRGFVDETVLVSDGDPNRILSISFWNSKEDADRYHQQHYDTITNMLKPVLESSPTLETFTVNASTAHRIAVFKAA